MSFERIPLATRDLAAAIASLSEGELVAARGWWTQAREDLRILAVAFDVPIERVCWAAAAISPGLGWQAIQRNLRKLLRAGYGPMPADLECPFGWRHAERARAILHGGDPVEICRGSKVEAFAANLLGDLDPVTVDRHIMRLAAPNHQGEQPSPSLSRRIGEHIRLLAAIRGEPPAVVQAALWLRKADAAR